jgi:hypothetical protein
MRGAGRDCGGCRYWSEMVAQSIGGADVEALCLAPEGPAKGWYTVATQTCPSFAKNTCGAVDDPPDCGEAVRAAYAAQAEEKHPNGAPKWAPDGTLLDDKGNRSIFDDVDE